MRDCAVIGVLLLVASCSESDESADAQKASTGSTEQGQSCTVEQEAHFFRRATEVDFSYKPYSGAELVQRAAVVVSGRIKSVIPGSNVDGPTTIFELVVGDVHKGSASPGSAVHIAVARAEAVTEDALRALNDALPRESVTAFLITDVLGERGVPEGASAHMLASPQGLIVAAACGLSQPLGAEPLFDERVSSEEELEGALEQLAKPR